ncbi:MAG: hypothetical protein ACYCTG_00690 [Ferrimicrobium sp.]
MSLIPSPFPDNLPYLDDYEHASACAILRVANQAEFCDECWDAIETGDIYEVAYSIGDPSAWRCVSCMRCRQDRNYLARHVERWYYGGLDEQLCAVWDVAPTFELGNIIERRRFERDELSATLADALRRVLENDAPTEGER